MMAPVREMPEPERRRHQQDLGLVVVTRRTDPPQQPEKRTRMDESTTRTQGSRGSQAQQTLDRLATALEMPPTFKEVAMHELKRAAVYVPMLLSAGVGLLWANKRFFAKVI